MDVLTEEAGKIGKLIKHIAGVEDLYVEEVTGLPQIQIQFNRDKIAQYGLNITDINKVIKTAFAGEAAGLVYEGEKRFDLVIRLTKEDRKDLSDVRGLYVSTPTGQQIPLEEVATVDFKNGPNQIQRDDTKRRITVGFNVRNRDVQSIVKEIQQQLDTKLKLPPGYYTTYGGQFEHLQAANKRLSIAVPVALLLILLLLYFTFNSIKESLLIFSAIPLAAIGGVFALLIRGMPFSISAGVGFIALFGVAVLNGIVLIAEFNRLKAEGITDIYERVLKGTKVRLRPVLLTAAVASLGFLPMALSGSSGAEVQRPLATVVIGGLLSATFLTLVVLPVLYILFEKKNTKPTTMNTSSSTPAIIFFLIAGSFLPRLSFAQSVRDNEPRILTLQQSVVEALKNNLNIKTANYAIDLQKELRKSTGRFEKTNISLTEGQINSIKADNNISITQRFEHPAVYKNQLRLGDEKIKGVELELGIAQLDLAGEVKKAYYELVFFTNKRSLLKAQDTLNNNLVRASTIRYKVGEGTLLEKATAETQSLEIKNRMQQNEMDILIANQQLKILLNTKDNIAVADTLLAKREFVIPADTAAASNNPTLKYLQQQTAINKQETEIQKTKRLPDFFGGYYNQSIRGIQNVNGTDQKYSGQRRFHAVQVGIAIPILPGGYKSKVAAARINEQVAATKAEYEQVNLKSRLNVLLQQYYKHKSAVEYYEKTGLPQADLFIKNAVKSFKSGELSFIQYQQSLATALKIKADYIDALYLLNLSTLAIENLTGIK